MTKFDASKYWETRLSARFDLQGVGDIGLPVSYNRYLYKVRAAAFRIAFAAMKSLPERRQVLDVGCGTGFYIEQWLKQNPESITGADITQTSIDSLAEQFPEQRFVVCDIGKQPPLGAIADRQYNVVSAFDILFHIVDEEAYARALQNITSLLAPGGYFVFSDNLSRRTQVHGPHQVSRSENEVRKLLQDNGLTIKKIIPMFVFMNDPVRSDNRVMRKIFSLIYRISAKSETHGRFVGALLYPIDVIAIRLMGRGPSTEIFVCQKAHQGV